MLDEVVIEMSVVRRLLIGAALGALGLVGVGQSASANEPSDGIVFLIDVSGSMLGPPLDQAKGALLTQLGSVPEDRAVGLRAYSGTCEDPLFAVVAPATGDRSELESIVTQLQATTGTPTGASLRAAAADLPNGSGTIVLLTDGFAECTPTPCEVATDLIAQGLEIRVNTVGYGFGGDPPDDLRCVSEVTGGQYFDADDEESLIAAFDVAVPDQQPNPVPTVAFLAALAVGAGIVIWAIARPSAPWNQRRLVASRVRIAGNLGRGLTPQPARDDDAETPAVHLEVRPGRWESRIVEGEDHG
ncbi:vWA domain-containing protein [Agromyces sp. SYSU T0242]|uniref:vWA domain-containing protein n=1 Tax=Agromyces litoreus TaxID=3158561 RepID=UPI003391CACE